MKSVLAIIAVLVLSACAPVPQRPIVEVQYVTKSASPEMYTIPEYPSLNITESTTQAEIAKWLTELEERDRELVNKILRLREFFEGQSKVESGAK